MVAEVRSNEREAVIALSVDHAAGPVPLSERRGALTMGLLWVSMVTGFPSVLIGFQWYGAGLSLAQVVSCAALSCVLLLAYCLPSCLVGARSGLTYALLSRNVFGRWGSRLVTFNLFWVSMAWYGLTAVFLADALRGLYHLNVSSAALAVGLALLMTFNNLFGFSGVANFARYVAGPILVAWVLYSFCQAGQSCPPAVWHEPARLSAGQALMLVSSFTIGYSVWGNEADYWRYAKPKTGTVAIPLMVSLTIGQMLFPVTGWMMARMSGVTDFAGATDLMNRFSFGGISVIAATVLIVTYVAINDSMLYGAINAWQNIKLTGQRTVVFIVALIGSVLAALFANMPNVFASIAALSAVILPCATIIIIMDHFFVTNRNRDVLPVLVPAFDALPAIRWPALSALLIGCSVGIVTSDLLPATSCFHVGIPALQAWIACLIAYPLCLYWPALVRKLSNGNSSIDK